MGYLLHQLISENAAAHPDNEAVVFKERSISYAELETETNRLAQGLHHLGVTNGDRVGIYMNRSIESIVSIFGVLKAGATYIPVDPLCPPDRLNYMVNKCDIKYLLTVDNKLGRVKPAFPTNCPLNSIIVMKGKAGDSAAFGTTQVVAWESFSKQFSGEAVQTATIETDIAYILFTSGSTGNPKGVMLSHLNALTFVNTAHEFFHIKPGDRFSNICPLHFDMSVVDLYVAFKAGATVVILPETDALFPLKIAEYIENQKITVWNSVPSALSILAAFKDLEQYDLSSLRLILFAGERFPLKYLRRLKELIGDARFCNMYGQTEANSSLYYWVDELPESGTVSLPIGKAFPNFEAFALDSDGNRIDSPGTEGELYVRASTVAYGYWGEPEKTKNAFVVNPLQPDLREHVYKTGDLVQLDDQGNFVFLGRKDHMIKSRGYRIEIGEIEAVLCSHPEIENAIVIPIPDELIGNRLTALVVRSPKSQIKKHDAVLYCSHQLPKYMIPETIEFRDAFPKTSSGKVDRKKLSETLLN